MVGLGIVILMLAMGGFCYASFTVSKDADIRAHETWARMRVERIHNEGVCDYRCKGCPVSELCNTRKEKDKTVQDCVTQWLRDREYLEEKVEPPNEANEVELCLKA